MTSMPSHETPNPPLATMGHDTHVQDQGAPSHSVNGLVEQSCREGRERRQDDEVDTLDHEDGLFTPNLSCSSEAKWVLWQLTPPFSLSGEAK